MCVYTCLTIQILELGHNLVLIKLLLHLGCNLKNRASTLACFRRFCVSQIISSHTVWLPTWLSHRVAGRKRCGIYATLRPLEEKVG